jgi:hypothetical protein
MPILLFQILTNLIVPLSSLNDPHVQISNNKSLLGSHLRDGSRNRKCDLRQTEEILRRAGSISEDNTTGILKAAGCNGCFKEKGLAVWVVRASLGRGVVGSP